MIASLAVIFANLWMQSLEGVNKIETNLIKQTSKKPSEKVQNSVKSLFGTVKVLIVKNVKIGFMLNVKTSETANTKKWVIKYGLRVLSNCDFCRN